MTERRDEQDAQQERLEKYQQETQEEKAARVAQERATEQKAKESLDKFLNESRGKMESMKTPFGIELVYDPNDTEDAEPEDYLTGAALETANELIRKADEIIKNQITEYVGSPEFKKLEAVFPDARQWTVDNLERSPEIALLILTAVYYCLPYIPDYLEEKNIEPTLTAFAAESEDGNILKDSPVMDFLEYVRTMDESKSAAEFQKFKDSGGLEKTTENIISHRPKNIPLSVARLTNKLQHLKGTPKNGIVELTVKTKPEDPKSPETFLTLDFSDVLKDFPEIKANIDNYDMRVLESIGGIMKTDQNIISLDEIYHAMGNISEISKHDRDKINRSLTKFRATMKGGNQSEIAAKYKYDLVVFDGPILHFDRMTGIKFKGKVAKSSICVYRYPQLLEYAEKRNQLVTVPLPVLQSGVNQTPFTIDIENYLITREIYAKEGYQPKKILYRTLYSQCGADSRKQQQRAREYAERFLNHHQAVGWIRGHRNEKDGITILL